MSWAFPKAISGHFLNGRKGVYVRTDEYSGHFHPQLATEYELRHLFDRRRLVHERRDKIIARARERFAMLIRHQSEVAQVFLTLTLSPRFPARPVCDRATLLSLRWTSVPYRQVGFPRAGVSFITQHESAIALQPCGPSSLSMVEANTWGVLTYATSIAEKIGEHSGIHTLDFLGKILVFLEHASKMVNELNISGELHIEVRLEGVRGTPWVHFPSGIAEQGPRSILDDAIQFDYATSTDTLLIERDQIAANLFGPIFFAMNWAAIADDEEKRSGLVRVGSKFNRG